MLPLSLLARRYGTEEAIGNVNRVYSRQAYLGNEVIIGSRRASNRSGAELLGPGLREKGEAQPGTWIESS